MNVKNKTLAQWKKLFSEELIHLFEKREIDSMFSLIFESFNWSKVDFLLKQNEYVISENDKLFFLLEELKKETPIQYLLNFSFFDDLKIPVKPGVLIPRQETEELVEWVDISLPDSNVEILDVCTGSGCISFALKNRNMSYNIDAIEFSEDAICQAKQNAQLLKLDVRFLHIDALKPWSFEKKWDCIVSNPPYIPNSDRVRMSNNVLDYEPEMALFVDDNDPLIFYRKIAEEGLLYLNTNGFLFFEIHEDLGRETKELIEAIGYKNVELKKDLNGKDRMIKAIKA